MVTEKKKKKKLPLKAPDDNLLHLTISALLNFWLHMAREYLDK